MINHKESKEVRIDSWSLKLLSRDMKSKKNPITNQQTIIKKYRKTKAMGNITPTVDHFPRNGQMGDNDP